jgi:hypothetical protein
MVEITTNIMKFSVLMVDPGLKAHQTPCAWASGSLDISHGINLMLCCKKREKNSKRKIEL